MNIIPKLTVVIVEPLSELKTVELSTLNEGIYGMWVVSQFRKRRREKYSNRSQHKLFLSKIQDKTRRVISL